MYKRESLLPEDVLLNQAENNRITKAIANIFGTNDSSIIDEIKPLLSWLYLKGGDFLYRQGDSGETMHLVLNGRLEASVEDDNGSSRIVGKIEKGDWVGEIAIILNTKRTTCIQAMRDSILLEISRNDFESLQAKHPKLLVAVTRSVIAKLNQSNKQKASIIAKTIVLLPISATYNLQDFANRLILQVSKIAKARLLTFDDHIATLPAGRSLEFTFFLDWINTLEDQHDHLFLLANPADANWTNLCLGQADKIIIVGNNSAAEIKYAANHLESLSSKVSRDFILLHPNGNQSPTNTKRHFTLPNISRYFHARMDRVADFERLARIYTGRAIGLVLSGGGAKGCAHLGVLRAIREAKIPIDWIGGTSVGAAFSGLIAKEYSTADISEIIYEGFVRKNPLGKFTIPQISFYDGKRLDSICRKYLGEDNIEDLWIPFYCVSSNMTTSKEHVHRRGNFWKAVRASMSLPGILPPVLIEENLFVDGALFNNLPIDIMQKEGVAKIIAVDLDGGSHGEEPPSVIPSSLEYIKDKFLRKHKYENVPSFLQTMLKSTMLGSKRKANALKSIADIYIDPPLEDFGLLNFKKYKEMEAIGYKRAVEILANNTKDLIN